MEEHARNLIRSELNIEERIKLLSEVRENFEIVHTSEYLNFLKCYFKALLTIMIQTTSPQFSYNDVHTLRHKVIDILGRLPHNEALRPFIEDLLRLVLQVLKMDNEENGVICIQIIIGILRNFRQTPVDYIQSLLNFVCSIYQKFEATEHYFFQEPSSGVPVENRVCRTNDESAVGAEDIKQLEIDVVLGHLSSPHPLGQLNPTFRSFKIIYESPSLVMLIFQLYGGLVQNNIPNLLPLMIAAISVPGPRKVPPQLNRRFVEFKAAQVKTVTFLSYFLRSFGDYMRQYEGNICKSIVNLLDTSPDSFSIRKDLLLSLKNVLCTDFKRGLFPLVDTLLEERVLVGTGGGCFQTLRPLAYSLLAEIIHLVHRDISLPQLSKIIYLLSSTMHDATLPLSCHITCARLMLNLVENIFNKGVDQTSMNGTRALLVQILDGFVRKFGTLKHVIPQAIFKGNGLLEHSKEVADTKTLIKTLCTGMKTIIWSITHSHVPRDKVTSSARAAHPNLQVSASPNMPFLQVFKGMKEDELLKASSILKSGLQCLTLFKEKDEEKEMINLFSQILIVLEPRDLMDIFPMCMPDLFGFMVSNTQLVHIFFVLLQTPKVFQPFADVLIHYLVSNKLNVLRQPDTPTGELVLHLFQFLFGSVSRTPDWEHILQPHLPVIVDVCVKTGSEDDMALGYMKLLRITFRALNVGKFEILLRELIPKLQPCLDLLLTMVEGPMSNDVKDLVLELCLTLPAHLSSLLPHLPRLMKPLVLTLKGTDDMVNLGLKTLEFWIDNLNPDFLEPSMENVMSDLTLNLWSHLRPEPYPFAKKALTILGKLGGRNRQFFEKTPSLECKINPEHCMRFILTFEPAITFLMPLDRCISLAVGAILQNSVRTNVLHRKHALKFLHVCFLCQMNLQGNVPGEEVTPGVLAAYLVSSRASATWDWTEMSAEKADLGFKTKPQLVAERSNFKILLIAIIAASAEPDLQDPQDDFLVNVCRHFAMIFHVYYSSTDSVTATGQHIPNPSSTRNMSSKESTHCSSLKQLDPFIFLDALVDVLGDEDSFHAKAALGALNVFSETLIFLSQTKHNRELTSRGIPGFPMMISSSSSSPPGVLIPVFEELLSRLMHCCYSSTRQTQIGGVKGLGALVGKVTIKTLCQFQVKIVCGLLYVLKRLPMNAKKEQEETNHVLTQVLRLVNNFDEENSEAQKKSFREVVEIFSTELCNINTSIPLRKNVQSCLAILASRTGSEVSELLEPFYQPLLRPIIMRPLRSKKIAQQVSVVTSLNYCLGLRPPLLKLSHELVNFLEEVLQIAEAEDILMFGKFTNQGTATSLVTLKRACIELLCTAMAWPDFGAPIHYELRSKIISMFFKSLTRDKPEIVSVAKQGLRQVMQQQKLPKDLLQSNLKPILGRLTHTKGLSIPFLKTLSSLLEVFSNWFSVTLGNKLLEHLKRLMETEKLKQCQVSWKPGEEPKLAAAIIELFHMLPPQSEKFLDELVTQTIDMEEALPVGQYHSKINSPYRLPLTKFLNRFATKSVDYFLGRLNQQRYFRRFMYIILSDAGQPLRMELTKSPQKILTTAFPQFFLEPKGFRTSDPGTSTDAYFHGLTLISSLIKSVPKWLHTNRVVFDTLVLLWKAPARIARLQNEQELSLLQVKESKWLVKSFLSYIRHDKTEINVLFHMLSIFLSRSRIDYMFLKDFYATQVAEGYPPNLKKMILLHFLQLFHLKQLSQDHVVVAMQVLILPMLSHAFQNDQTKEVIDSDIIKTIVENFFDPPEENMIVYDEPMRIEILQLVTLLVKHLYNDLMNHRKVILQFCWSHLKGEDCASKQWAFVSVCYFLVAYQFPEKIVIQVLMTLLKSSQPENKVLSNRALDILMPSLPQTLPPGDQKLPVWIFCIKKMLLDDGHSVPNLIHIFQLITRHPGQFYAFRSQFVPHMVNCLSRLGLQQNTTVECRRLSIELAGLVVSWENQRQSETTLVPNAEGSDASNQRCTDRDSKCLPHGTALPDVLVTGTPGSSGEPDQHFKPNAAMEEMIINFLIRTALVIETKDMEATLMYKQSLEQLSKALEIWPNANVKFNYLDKLLSNLQPSQSKDPATTLSQGLEVMSKMLEKQPQLFIRININQISQIVEYYFNNKILDDGKSMCLMLKTVFAAFPLESNNIPQEVKMLHQRVKDLIHNHLAASLQVSLEVRNVNSMVSFAVFLIKTLTEEQKNFTDPFILDLTRVLLRIARDMSSSSGSQRTDKDYGVSTSHPFSDMRLITSTFKDILRLISEKAGAFPECKRSLSQILNTVLSEKGVDSSVLLCIFDVVKQWITIDVIKPATESTSTAVLSLTEIISYLQKLAQVDKRNFSSSSLEQWDRDYLHLLYELCADSNKYPLFVRKEVFENVERKFMLGLRASDPGIRQNFFTLYNDSLEKRLFTRLQYIIQVQDWEAVGDVFWLKQGLDLLLSVLIEKMPVMLAPNSAQIPPLVPSSALPNYSRLPEPFTSASKESKGPLTFERLVCKHAQFLNQKKKLQVGDLISPLRELAHTDGNVAYQMWILVFPIVWSALDKDEQMTLAKPMMTLLSKDYHKKQQEKRPNVVQALLEGIQLCNPQPRLPSELIKYAGKTFNAWHTSVALLESHAMWFLNETKCSESLDELYRLLNEEDMRYGLRKKTSMTAETRAGISLVQHGYWQQAQNLFYQSMIKATQRTCNLPPKTEMCFWEEQWIYCSSQLGQWDALADFGKSVNNYEILLDCLWKTSDWEYLKNNVIVNTQVEETPKLHFIQALLALHDTSQTGVNNIPIMLSKGSDLALEQWWRLPEMSFHSRIPLLQQFQQFVEVEESVQINMDIANGFMQHPGKPSVGAHECVELKGILETWRLRTPNKWDNCSMWYDLLQARNKMFNIIIDAFKDKDPQLLNLGYRDKAWNVNTLAHIARKQGLPDVSISILQKMYGHSTMEVQEAFVKVREHAQSSLEAKGELISGLNLINGTNLEYFPAKNRAEIFRLKGDFLLKLSDSENANKAYSNSITLFKHLPKGWISWGNYCNMVFKDTNEEIWLEYAASCFLEGIKCGVSNSRSHVARVLYLLSFDTVNEPVGKAFDQYLDHIPHWIWLSWIPQLLLSLQRSEAPHCKLVLLKIGTVFPQALYYWLRTYLTERQDPANKTELGKSLEIKQQRMEQQESDAGARSPGLADWSRRSVDHTGSSCASADSQDHLGRSSGGLRDYGSSHGQEYERYIPGEGNTHVGHAQPQSAQSTSRHSSSPGCVACTAKGFNAAKDIFDNLRSQHSNLYYELEIFLAEIGSRFVTVHEERLLSVINASLQRCYNFPVTTTTEVPRPLKKEISEIYSAFFSADTMNNTADFVKEYKQDFEKDFDPDSKSTSPITLSEFTKKLKHWKNVLQRNVEERFPSVLKLEEESKVLRDFHVIDVEIPGQYYTDQEIAPDHTVKLDRVGADIAVVRKHGTSYRRLTLIGSDGSKHYFSVLVSSTPNAQYDERMLQLFRAMNRMFDKHKESRRRHLYLHTPIIVPIWSQVRMVEDDLTYSSLLEVYEFNCARNKREADLPINYFKERLNQAYSGEMSPEEVLNLRLDAYNYIVKTSIGDNMFSQYMYKTLPTGNHMWQFKKQFGVQMALSSFVSFMLQIGGRSPHKILFSKNAGKIFQTNFHPVYDAQGMIESNEPVPFRFTRNMQFFFSHFGVEGPIVSSICAAAQALVSPKQTQHIWYHLAMFFRDEMLSWSCSRSLGMPSTSSAPGCSMPSDCKLKVESNVEQTIGRIKRIAPQYYLEEEVNAMSPQQSVQSGVNELIEAALAPRNLCMMDPTWHPWF